MRARREEAFDLGLAAILAFACVAELYSGDAPTPSHGAIAAALLFAVPMLLRRSATVRAASIYLLAVVIHVLIENNPDHAGSPWFGALLLGYAFGRHARLRLGLPEVALLVIANSILWGTNDQTVPTDFFYPAFFTVLAWAAGRAVRFDVRVAAEVHEDAARVIERAEQERERARAAERRRIAREMHDVIAHSVSVMVVQAGGGRRILATDPARAVEAAALIEHTGRDAIAELRTLLGVLDSSPERSGAPAPSLVHLADLVARAADAGLQPRLMVEGDLTGLPAGLDMSAYRIVQEALTNALRHAGPVDVAIEIRRLGDAVELSIENAAPPADHPGADLTRPGGHGLMGMAERASLYGGRLETGATPEGGFAVRTTLTFEHHRMESAA